MGAGNKFKKYSFTDTCRKIANVVLKSAKSIQHFCRKCRFYFYTSCWVEYILGNVFFSRVTMNVKIGNNACFYPAVVMEIAENASLVIGNNFTLSYGSIIACNYLIEIGNFVMVGEYSSIRDTTHNHVHSTVPYSIQGDTSEKIIIGSNVWIGRGTLILPGSVIEDGVIIGAHSVVKGNLQANCMYAGAPVKMIREKANA